MEKLIEFDMTGYLDADGKLTEQGRDEVRNKLLAQFRARFPLMTADVLNQTVESLIDGIARRVPADIHLLLKVRGAIAQCERAARMLEGVTDAIYDGAQLIDRHKDVSGPHVFACGAAASSIALAEYLLSGSVLRLREMLECKECFGEASSGKPLN